VQRLRKFSLSFIYPTGEKAHLKPNTAVSSDSHPTAPEEASPGESTHADGDAATPRTTVESGEQASATSGAINQPDVKTIIDELLTYTIFYRNKCTAADLHKLIVHFYLPTEISMAKRTVMREYEIYLTGSQYVTSRRQTSTRSAHDAEADDILGMLESLDNLNVLDSVRFVAAHIDRLPKYGPNEINVCTVVDKQQQIEQEINAIKNNLQNIATNGDNYTAPFVVQLEAHMITVQQQIDKLRNACDSVTSLAEKLQQHGGSPASESSARLLPAPRVATDVDLSSRSIVRSRDVSRNIIITGVAESRNPTDWCDIVTTALRTASGRDVKFDDAIRLGKFIPDKPPRPILVKLCTPWDKRIVVGGAWRLKDNDQLRRVYIRDDLPLAERRRKLLERLRYRATRDHHEVTVSTDGILTIDGIDTFSLQDGFIQQRDHGGR
jgi:hypothetical protein